MNTNTHGRLKDGENTFGVVGANILSNVTGRRDANTQTQPHVGTPPVFTALKMFCMQVLIFAFR